MPGLRNSFDDEQARRVFDEIYEKTFQDVVAFCRRRAASIEDADDAIGEVFVVAWRRIEDVAAADKPVAWLLAVAHGVLSNQRRSQARGLRLIDRLARRRPHLDVDPADIVIANAAVADAYATLASLPARDREILGLAILECLSYDEISEVLGERPAVVRTRLYRARRRYTETLQANRARAELPHLDVHDMTERRSDDEGGVL